MKQFKKLKLMGGMLLLLLISCSGSSRRVVDPGLAEGTPCKPPCWQGVTPGVSTCEETGQAMQTLQGRGWRNAHVSTDSYCYYRVSPSGFGVIVGIRMGQDKVVKSIGGRAEFYHPLEILLEQFGDPEGLVLNRESIRCTSCEEWIPPKPPDKPTQFTWEMNLLYPSQGLEFLVIAPQDSAGCICPEMDVYAFCYYPPASMEEILKDDYLANTCSVAFEGLTEEDITEWHGFGGEY